MVPRTSLLSHGAVEREPLEIYGSGDTLLRIGNGGAGATGLIATLAEDYIKMCADSTSIAWVCNHSRNTQLALLYGYIDIALTYEREPEQLAISEGWAVSAGCMFHDHFCLVGPVIDPAGIRSCSSLIQSISWLAESQCLVHSRADFSATMFKERSIWESAGLEPWTDDSTYSWYRTSLSTPAAAIVNADAEGAYLLTDRSTLLRQTALGNVTRSTVFVEPSGADDVLMNSCHALYSPSSPPDTKMAVKNFLSYLMSERGQRVIATFGEQSVGLPLFAPVADGYARTTLLGGRPIGGAWRILAQI